MSAEPTIPATTAVLPARFRAPAPLRAGRMARVFRAIDDRDRRVAVKVLDAALASDAAAVRRFHAEYETLAALDHRAFPRAYERGLTDGGLPYFSMELVEGIALAAAPAMLAVCVRASLADLAEAVACLHARGLVHGHLTLGRMVGSSDARLRLLDPGAAAPGEVADDLYAMGACAYQLWTGRPPTAGTPLPPGRFAEDADPGLEAVILALLAPEPARRPTPTEVLAALGRRPAAPGGPPGEPGPQDLLAELETATQAAESGDKARALALAAAVAERARAAGDAAADALALAVTSLVAGDPAGALDRALAWTACDNRKVIHRARQLAARAALALGRHVEALAHARVALAIAEDWQSLPDRTVDLALVERARAGA